MAIQLSYELVCFEYLPGTVTSFGQVALPEPVL